MRLQLVGLLVRIAAASLLFAGGAPANAQGTGYVFISNERSNTVTVLDPATDYKVVRQIETSRRPRDMHFDKAHKLLYVACGDDDTIDVIGVGKLAVTRHIPTGKSPEMFAIAPDGKSLYVSDEDDALVAQIDIASGQMLQQIPTGPEPEGVLVTGDASTIYITSEVADMVHVFDARSGKMKANVLVGSRPRRFALRPDAGEVWVTDELSGQANVIDTATDRIKATIDFLPPGFRPSDVTPVGIVLSNEGKTMYVALGRSNHVAFVDAETKKIEKYVLVGSRAWSVTENAAGTRLYVANGLSDDMSVIDIASARNIRSIPTGRVPHTVVIDE
jgi:PQQ-dependent catabolism-associated beta-propeller protein